DGPGTASRQIGEARVQRGSKRQPVGKAAIDGTIPSISCKGLRSFSLRCPKTGNEASRPCV
ncbi:hypothetical protein NY486_15840, partial [Enterobacter hormaechei]|nr:hypothetical protein [Enterobacter hormaechei]